MTTATTNEAAPEKARGRRLAAWSGIGGALLLGGAGYLVLSLAPAGKGPHLAQTISDFYASGTDRITLLVAEPLSLLGGFLLLWFLGHLTGMLPTGERGSSHYPSSSLAGGVMFIVLAFASFTAATTVAGSVSFYEAVRVDPHTAMLFSHLGYVLLTGAMFGAAVLLAAEGRRIRETSSAPRWLGTMAYALVPLSLLSFFFVYLPLMLFLIWILLMSVSTLREN